MKPYWPIVLVVVLLAIVPFVTTSNVVLNFLITTLLIALAGQGWNLRGQEPAQPGEQVGLE